MCRAARIFLLLVMTATLASGCYFDVSSDSNQTTGAKTAEELGLNLEAHFALQAGGATADIVCPAGLSGKAGRQLRCTGTTSDGYALEIAVLERGKGAFRWDVVNSVPVGAAKSEVHHTPATSLDVTTYVDGTTGRRCQTNEFGYICTED